MDVEYQLLFCMTFFTVYRQHDMKILNYMLCDCVKSTETKRNPSNLLDLCDADDGCKMPNKLQASIHCSLNQNTETEGNCGFQKNGVLVPV